MFLKCVKSALGVKYNTNKVKVHGECGTFPPSVTCNINVISFYNRLKNMHSSKPAMILLNELEGPPCWLCVESEHVAPGSVWVFRPHLVYTIHSSFCHGEAYLLMSKGVLWAVVRVSLHYTESCPLAFQNLMTDTLSKLTMLLFALPGSIQLVWQRNGYLICLVHAKAYSPFSHEIVSYISPNWSRPVQFMVSLVNSSIFLGWWCQIIYKACHIWLHTYKAFWIVRSNKLSIYANSQVIWS